MILSHLCTREAPLLSILRRELALSSGLVPIGGKKVIIRMKVQRYKCKISIP